MNQLLHDSPRFSEIGRNAAPPTIAHLMTTALQTPGLLSLAVGFTDNGSLPVEAVRAAGIELGKVPGEPEYLQYGTNQGRPTLRGLLAQRLSALEGGLDAEELTRKTIITNGSQQALYLAIQVLCNPGDIVLVDRPSYFVFLEMLTGLGVRARSLPVDEEGRIDRLALARLLREINSSGEAARLKAVYFVSYFSNPSGKSLSEQEKDAIAEELSANDLVIPVIEDAAYRELYFKTPYTARSVLSLPSWSRFPKLYLSTLTKSFATGLKVGFGFCSHEALLNKMLFVKGHHDFGTANYNQAVLERVIENGGFDSQLARIRKLYCQKMEGLHSTLERSGLAKFGWKWRTPEGGLYLWLEAPSSLNTGMNSAFCAECLREKVIYVPGELCFGDKPPTNFVRLSYGVLGGAELSEAGRRFSAAVKNFARAGAHS